MQGNLPPNYWSVTLQYTLDKLLSGLSRMDVIRNFPQHHRVTLRFECMFMDFHKDFFKYEGKGVMPAKKIAFDRDWIAQTLEIIAEKNQS